jgi:hypothetical protein
MLLRGRVLRRIAGGVAGLALAVAPARGLAQRPAPRLMLGAQAIPLLTHVAPALAGGGLTEGYLTQPLLLAHAGAWAGRLELEGVLDLEGLTLRRGELNPGIWGEGYVDRRHPHTYLHEAVATARVLERGGAAGSISLGRGFAPFGTDDPMVRPFVKYPANHHLAQILEREVAIVAARAGAVTLEAGLFDGDEPTGPSSLGRLSRFGDSWSARLTVRPLGALEAQASHARVASPEVAYGGGADQRKSSLSLRYADGAGRYALAEWARTAEYDDGRRGLAYGSWLAEAAARRGIARLGLRLERTDRPEEERLLDPFRSPRPGADVHHLGVTRWSILTVMLEADPVPGALRLRPFVEVARLTARERVSPSFFVPAEFYGSDRIWSLSLGARIGAGMLHDRMGRYGAALPAAPMEPSAPMHHEE